MIGTDLRTDPGLALWNDRVGEGYDINTFFYHSSGKFSSQLFVIEHYRYTWMNSRNDIETFFHEKLAIIGSDFFQMVS